MNESIEHIRFVEMIIDYVKDVIPEEKSNLLMVDLPSYNHPVLSYSNFIPDVKYKQEDLLIIGEAKTIDDFNREHSRKQYEAYLDECKMFPGKSIIVISIPWNLLLTAKNHFKLLKKRNNYTTKIVILSNSGTVVTV